MKYKQKWPAILGTVSLAVVATWFFLQDNAGEKEPDTLTQATTNSLEPTAMPLKTPNQRPTQKTVASQKEELVSEPEVWMTEAVEEQMQDIAQAYANNMRFPTYSKPLSRDDWNLLNPRPFVAKDAPLDINENISASIVLPHYVAHRDETLPVEVHVSGLANEATSAEEAIAFFPAIEGDASNYRLTHMTHGKHAAETRVFSGSIPSEGLQRLASGEQIISASLRFSDGQSAQISAAFKVVDTDAVLTSVGDAYADGAHLMIPVSFDIKIDGHYRIQGNLFDAESNQPVSHLNSLLKLSTQQNEGVLKVHAATLRAQNAEGPYTLTNINITRSPAHPGDTTGYGSSRQVAYSVNGFDLSVYDDTEYQDPEALKRLEFLQRLAGGN